MSHRSTTTRRRPGSRQPSRKGPTRTTFRFPGDQVLGRPLAARLVRPRPLSQLLAVGLSPSTVRVPQKSEVIGRGRPGLWRSRIGSLGLPSIHYLSATNDLCKDENPAKFGSLEP